MPAVTVADVKTATGTDVTATELLLATGIVEACAGVDLSTGTAYYRPSDLGKLKRAVVWQAVYVHGHPELLTAEPGLVSASANGASKTLEPGAETELAPLAARVLKGLSWRSRVKTSLPERELDRSLRSQDPVHDEGRQQWVPL